MAKRRANVALPPVHPNVGLFEQYRKKLQGLVEEVRDRILKTVDETYDDKRLEVTKLAQDDENKTTHSDVISEVMRDAVTSILEHYEESTFELADYFARAASHRTDRQLEGILRRAGIAIDFEVTPAQREVIDAIVHENVSLIRSIQERYLGDVERMVLRSVQTGRDKEQLTRDLYESFDVSWKRAAFIANDQNNKATSLLNRVRQIELGATKAIWRHSHAGRYPRPTHVANDGKEYDVREGWWDPAVRKYIWPGTEINCVPSETPIDFADGVEVAYRRRYCGELTKLVTNTGKTLRATPNHPIATPNGWRAAGLLHEGDDVIEVGDDVFGLSPAFSASAAIAECQVDQAVPSIAEVFSALAEAGAMCREAGRVGNFHGDGVANSNIDIVYATRPLRFGLAACAAQRGIHFALTMTNWSRFRPGAEFERLKRIFTAAPRFMRRLSEALAALGSLSPHAQVIGLRTATYGAASYFNAFGYGVARDAVSPGHRQQAGARLVLPTKRATLVSVIREPFDGQVFNLQTQGGWYSAGGIISHNCRCTSTTLVPWMVQSNPINPKARVPYAGPSDRY